MLAIWLLLAAAIVMTVLAWTRPGLMGPPWLRAAIFVVLVIAGMAIVDRLWGTPLAFGAYLAVCLLFSALIGRGLPPYGK